MTDSAGLKWFGCALPAEPARFSRCVRCAGELFKAGLRARNFFQAEHLGRRIRCVEVAAIPLSCGGMRSAASRSSRVTFSTLKNSRPLP